MHADHYMLSLVSLHRGEVIFRAERKRERERWRGRRGKGEGQGQGKGQGEGEHETTFSLNFPLHIPPAFPVGFAAFCPVLASSCSTSTVCAPAMLFFPAHAAQ